jgi:hypothetical protein
LGENVAAVDVEIGSTRELRISNADGTLQSLEGSAGVVDYHIGHHLAG